LHRRPSNRHTAPLVSTQLIAPLEPLMKHILAALSALALLAFGFVVQA